MAFLSDRDRQAVQQELAKLAGPVKLIVFTQELGAETCVQTEQLLKEVADSSDQVSLEIYNLILDREKAEQYGVDRVPAIVVEGARDYGIRFYGLPAGYEFSNLIDSMLLASSGRPQLSDETLDRLASVQKPVSIQVFTTPT
ncbi:MAG: thioredoxin family protein [Candidatus Rokubacteria bacterium]|nr:thioredoxin family protein [Candidatus Rokubacteria bacterium]